MIVIHLSIRVTVGLMCRKRINAERVVCQAAEYKGSEGCDSREVHGLELGRLEFEAQVRR